MSNRTAKEGGFQAELSPAVPDYLFEDLKKVASFSGMSVEDLAYSCVVERIAGDYRMVKRVEFEQHANKTFEKDDFHSRPARDFMSRIIRYKENFSLPILAGGVATDTSFPGRWLLMVFHRHLA